MIIKIGEVSRVKEEWLNLPSEELDVFENEAIRIVRNWTNRESFFYITTSGSTGKPKEIVLSRDLLIWSAQNTLEYLKLKNEKIGCCLPLSKAGGFMMLIRSLIYDWDIHIVEPTANPLQFLDDDCTFVSLVPYQLIQILKSAESKNILNSINKILLGGAAIPLDLQKQLNELTTLVFLGYGMTETASHIALISMNKSNFNEGFAILPGVEIKIDDADKIIIAISKFGLKFETNDLGRIVNGRLQLLGRIENFINSGGLKIHANELEAIIESVLVEISEPFPFVVLGLEHAALGEAISIVSEGKEITDELKNIINSAIEKKLGSKFKIVNWKRVAQFPLINQKIDKRQLKVQFNKN